MYLLVAIYPGRFTTTTHKSADALLRQIKYYTEDTDGKPRKFVPKIRIVDVNGNLIKYDPASKTLEINI